MEDTRLAYYSQGYVQRAGIWCLGFRYQASKVIWEPNGKRIRIGDCRYQLHQNALEVSLGKIYSGNFLLRKISKTDKLDYFYHSWRILENYDAVVSIIQWTCMYSRHRVCARSETAQVRYDLIESLLKNVQCRDEEGPGKRVDTADCMANYGHSGFRIFATRLKKLDVGWSTNKWIAIVENVVGD